jgi:hypothetical protein
LKPRLSKKPFPNPVELFRADTLLEAIREAGFPDLTRPDVGAKRMIAFAVARRS